ncbi:hypothetical protein [Halocynthiibacter namhaensis]|uniref:hypothetical protein n=1 Tax=Halocynthiibacter namhaensis TaxID=1290553 RepID=UPI0005795E31|nr:hypothetical protein [Halocynthiibacter namhaensis]
MQIYAPYQYPDPEMFCAVNVGKDTKAFITIRFHTCAEGKDFIMDVNPDTHDILKDIPHGNLLIDLWSDAAGDDWIASSVFKVTSDTLELSESRAFGDRRNSGLIDLMATRAQNITGNARGLTGMERSTDRQF